MARSFVPTKSEATAEILRCGRDCSYWLQNYAVVQHPTRGRLPFKLFDYQDQLLRDFEKHRFNVILKSRQLGCSTIVAGYIAWLMLFRRDKAVLVMATKQKTSMNLLKKTKLILQELPQWLMISEIIANNATSIELSNGSKMTAVANSEDAGRSEALSLLVIDEAAHIPNMLDLWAGLAPTLAMGGNCIALSSPRGVGNWFHKIYTEAESGENEFYPTKLPWSVHPWHDKAWFLKETKNLSAREIAQEYLCSFLASGDTVISSDDIERLEHEVQDPKYKTGFDRNLWIWKEPAQGHSYLVTSDVSRGDGKDFSTAHVLDLNTFEIVAEYKGKVKSDILAPFLSDLGKQYFDAILAVENMGVGLTVVDKLIESQYPNLYYQMRFSNEYINQWDALSEENKTVAGYTISYKTRPIIIAKLEEYIRLKKIKQYSSRFASETKTFIWKDGGRPEAAHSYNDDLIMSMAAACWISTQVTEYKTIEAAYATAMIGTIKKTSKPFTGGLTDFLDNEKTAGQLTKADYKNFGWILKG